MIQYILTIIIVLTALVVACYRLIRFLKNPVSKCDGCARDCSGCAAEDLKNLKRTSSPSR